MQNAFWQSGSDSRWFLNNLFFFQNTFRDPPFMEKSILDFHFDYLIFSLIAFIQKYFSNKAQNLSEYLLHTFVFLCFKVIVFPYMIQEELITSSFCKILGWSILIQLFAKLIVCEILADTALPGNTSKKKPLCSC